MTAGLAERTPTITLGLVSIMIAIALVAPENSQRFDLLVLDRAEPRWWPWLTAHVLHTDAEHLGWNVVVSDHESKYRTGHVLAHVDHDRRIRFPELVHSARDPYGRSRTNRARDDLFQSAGR